MRYFVLLMVLVFVNSASAGNWVINPSDDGTIAPNGNMDTDSELISWGSAKGVMEFPVSSINGQITSATLSINPYALPLHDYLLHVYGYQSNDGRLTASDYYAGTYLGDWTLPNLYFKQDAYFDVTTFMQTVRTPYAGFIIQCDGMDFFSSLEYNYGHPSQLTVTTVPEPATLLLFTLGGLALRRKH
ncbi:MAG: PEP-CTERM sorting domain-containing protein [Sedimentisphaerales bacterium]